MFARWNAHMVNHNLRRSSLIQYSQATLLSLRNTAQRSHSQVGNGEASSHTERRYPHKGARVAGVALADVLVDDVQTYTHGRTILYQLGIIGWFRD